MPTEDNHCAQCNKIRALPWSQTRRDMTADHTMERVCQARPVEAPKAHANDCSYWNDVHTGCNCGVLPPEPAKPPESEALAFIKRLLPSSIDPMDKVRIPLEKLTELESLIEADAQHLKDATERADELADKLHHANLDREGEREFRIRAERERDELRNELNSTIIRAVEAEDELAAVKGKLVELIRNVRDEISKTFWSGRRLNEACAKAEAGEQSEIHCPYCGEAHVLDDCESAKLAAQYNKPDIDDLKARIRQLENDNQALIRDRDVWVHTAEMNRGGYKYDEKTIARLQEQSRTQALLDAVAALKDLVQEYTAENATFLRTEDPTIRDAE